MKFANQIRIKYTLKDFKNLSCFEWKESIMEIDIIIIFKFNIIII